MNKIINISIWLFIGCVLVAFISNFSIGSDEYWQNEIRNNFYELFFTRIIFSTVVGILWAGVSYFLYRLAVGTNGGRLGLWRYLMISTIVYLIVAVISVLIFVGNVSNG